VPFTPGGDTPAAPPPPAADRLTYRLPDVARLTGLSLTTAQRLVTEGKLPAVRAGRAVLVRRGELDDFINGLPRAARNR
jgi:excisionase family DNA binding protein